MQINKITSINISQDRKTTSHYKNHKFSHKAVKEFMEWNYSNSSSEE